MNQFARSGLLFLLAALAPITSSCHRESPCTSFDPITLIVHPTEKNADGGPKPLHCFSENGTVYQDGTTLPDRPIGHNVELSFTSYDDPRDKQGYCGAKSVQKYRFRVLYRDGSFFTPGPAIDEDGLPYPHINTRSFHDLKSGDYFIQVQAMDDSLVVGSTPETVLVKVNYAPYITYLRIAPGRSTMRADSIDVLAVRNSSPLNPIVVQLEEGESLDVRVKGRDIHSPDPLSPPPPGVPDLLAAAFDSNTVVGVEFGRINVVEAYRVFFESVILPGYEPAPGLNSNNPYSTSLEVTRPGVYKLIADVHDESEMPLSRGRRGRIIRYIKVVR